MFINALYNSNACAVLVSEENEDPIIVPEEFAGPFCVAFDPLDGSSNIDCNVSTGTIFGVWRRVSFSANYYIIEAITITITITTSSHL